MSRKLTSFLVSLYAALLLIGGIALLFAPDESVSALAPGAPSVLTQLLGAALIGFASTNWVVRRTTIGGIYGRAVVAGNQAFAFIGLLVVVRGVPAAPGPAFWALLALFAFGAVLYSLLLWRGPRLDAPPAR